MGLKKKRNPLPDIYIYIYIYTHTHIYYIYIYKCLKTSYTGKRLIDIKIKDLMFFQQVIELLLLL